MSGSILRAARGAFSLPSRSSLSALFMLGASGLVAPSAAQADSFFSMDSILPPSGIYDALRDMTQTGRGGTPPPASGRVGVSNIEDSAYPEYADQHIVVAIDISSSVKEYEYRMMMMGLRDALLSMQEDPRYGRNGLRVFSLLYYGSYSYHAASWMLDKDGLDDFVHANIWDLEKDTPARRRDDITLGGTSIVNAMSLAGKLFKHEQDFLNFTTGDRRVIIAGDQCPDPDRVQRESRSLSQKYGAVFYGLPIVVNSIDSTGLAECFERNVITPNGMHEYYSITHKNGEVESFKGRELDTGVSIPVASYTEMREPLADVLRASAF